MEEKTNSSLQLKNVQEVIPGNELLALYGTAGTLKLSDDENEKLLKLFDNEDFEIREDGEVYLPQVKYRNRLNQSVGIGNWGLIVKGTSQEEMLSGANSKKIRMFLNGILVIRNCFIAEAVGEAEIFLNNGNQSLASGWEAAKSDCIKRCCKDASIGQQSATKAFSRAWKKEHAILVQVRNYKSELRNMWRRKDIEPLEGELGPAPVMPTVQQRPAAQAAQQNNNNSGLPWLNEPDYAGVLKELESGVTVSELRKKWRISNPTFTKIENTLKQIWNGRLEKIKIKAELVHLYNSHEKEVNEYPWLKALFQAKNEGYKNPAA